VGLFVSRENEVKVKGATSPYRDYYVAALPLHGQFDTTKSLLDPRSGFRIGLSLSPEVSLQGDQASTYLKARLDMSVYESLGSGTVLAVRGSLGSIVGAELSQIAPSRRFYAGGGGSVRGYGYDSIGPTDDANLSNGGRSLAEFSLEARIATSMFDGALSVVPFVDAGTVGPNRIPTFDGLRFGAGIGLRYNTGIGPIRLDVATPINRRPQDSWISVYVSLGQAF